MKKVTTIAMLGLFTLGLVGTGYAEGESRADIEKEATQICKKKGLSGDLLDKCIKEEINKRSPSTSTPVPPSSPSGGSRLGQ
ncbi:MAG: hypothetical protein HY540_07225 [Deltaproteobacteria bacterium]|nr:hypothetical protein [Deltaproteobacteria bacterium]